MRRIIASSLALVTVLGVATTGRADDRVTTVERTEHLSYPAKGCKSDVRFRERYRLRFRSVTHDDGTYRWRRSTRGTVTFRENGQRFTGRFVLLEHSQTVRDPGTYGSVQRMRASAPDGTTLRVRGHERYLLSSDGGPPIVTKHVLHRSCE
jgi:hypothetical protein